jgi:Mlc titration factor MtfA (ptsG expression regulator)
MVFGWTRARRRRRLAATPFPPAWQRLLDAMPAYRALSEPERDRLRAIARVLVDEKEYVGAGGLEMTDTIRVTIAAQAARLLLGLEHDHFRDLRTIVVYPTAFRGRDVGPLGIVSEGVARGGEAWYRGPVVLSWDATSTAAFETEPPNVVLHELAHRLDMLDGRIDGTPPLRTRAAYGPWRDVMTASYERLREDEESGRATLLDGYGANDPSEFFAVATECFFGAGAELARRDAALYALLADYYGQDPARRSRGA